MKKITFLFAGLALFLLKASSQNFGELEWQKKKIPAVLTEVPQSASITQDAIKQKLSQLGYNGKETKGVYVYKGVRISEISDETLDILLSVDRKSRKEKDASIVYFAVSRGYENYIKADDDPVLVAKIKQYCLHFTPWAEAQQLEEDIKNQEDKVKSTEKKYQDYQDDSESLQKKLKKIQDDIEENKKNIEKQKNEVENQKRALDILKAKRKS